MSDGAKALAIVALIAVGLAGAYLSGARERAQSACAGALNEAEMVERGLHGDVLDWSEPSPPSLAVALNMADGCRDALGIPTSADGSTAVWSALQRQCAPNADHGPDAYVVGLLKDCQTWRLGPYQVK